METSLDNKLTHLMSEINSHRYLQHRIFKGTNDAMYATTTLCVDPVNDSLHILFHDAMQPLVHYVMTVQDFKALCAITERPTGVEQEVNKLPEEAAAESAGAA